MSTITTNVTSNVIVNVVTYVTAYHNTSQGNVQQQGGWGVPCWACVTMGAWGNTGSPLPSPNNVITVTTNKVTTNGITTHTVVNV